MALATYHALKCSVYGRVDMILHDGVPYVLEINTLPGDDGHLTDSAQRQKRRAGLSRIGGNHHRGLPADPGPGTIHRHPGSSLDQQSSRDQHWGWELRKSDGERSNSDSPEMTRIKHKKEAAKPASFCVLFDWFTVPGAGKVRISLSRSVSPGLGETGPGTGERC